MNIYLIIGVPGSGKTNWLLNKPGAIFDDISQIENGLISLKTILKERSSDNIYISDVNFCDVEVLKTANIQIKELINSVDNIKYILFNISEKDAINNVSYRNDGRHVVPTIKRFVHKVQNVQKFLEENNSELSVIQSRVMQIPNKKKM